MGFFKKLFSSTETQKAKIDKKNPLWIPKGECLRVYKSDIGLVSKFGYQKNYANERKWEYHDFITVPKVSGKVGDELYRKFYETVQLLDELIDWNDHEECAKLFASSKNQPKNYNKRKEHIWELAESFRNWKNEKLNEILSTTIPIKNYNCQESNQWEVHEFPIEVNGQFEMVRGWVDYGINKHGETYYSGLGVIKMTNDCWAIVHIPGRKVITIQFNYSFIDACLKQIKQFSWKKKDAYNIVIEAIGKKEIRTVFELYKPIGLLFEFNWNEKKSVTNALASAPLDKIEKMSPSTRSYKHLTKEQMNAYISDVRQYKIKETF